MSSLRQLVSLCCVLVSIALPAHAAELLADMTTAEPVIAPVKSQHSVKVGSTTLRYTATFAETVLSEGKQPQATISATSYVLDGVKPAATRPVLFAFNGGPGASSSPLHFGALGPRRWKSSPDGKREIVENPFSLLDAADLVFIDPVGTGFSRGRPGGDPSQYWSVDGDARAVLTLIRNWLRDNDRAKAPVFIVGESYGGFRLATMAKELDDISIAGLILISPLLDASATEDASGNDLPFVFQLPSLASAAWHHEMIDRKGRTIEQFYEEAAHFSQSDYIVALQQGAALPASQRAQLAARMAMFIGLPATTIEAANLRIDSQKFLESLLGDRKLLVGRLDTRVTAPVPVAPPKDPNRAAAADDPALGLKGANVIRSDAIKAYLERDLQVKTSRDYLSLTLEVNFRWNWQRPPNSTSFYINPTPNIATLMSKQPAARLLLLGGYFDLAVPLLAPRYALTHAGVPLERLSIKAFAAGHSPFESDSGLASVSEVMHAFVRAQK